MTDTIKQASQINQLWNEISGSMAKSTPKILSIAKILYTEKQPTQSVVGVTKLGIPKVVTNTDLDKQRFTDLVDKLPFGKAVANKFVAIAADRLISKHVKSLPASYNTIYELREQSIASKALCQTFDEKDAKQMKQINEVWKTMLSGFDMKLNSNESTNFTLNPMTTQAELSVFFSEYAKRKKFKQEEPQRTTNTASEYANIRPFAQANDVLKSQQSCVVNYDGLEEETFNKFSDKLVTMIEAFNKANSTKINVDFFDDDTLKLFAESETKMVA